MKGNPCTDSGVGPRGFKGDRGLPGLSGQYCALWSTVSRFCVVCFSWGWVRKEGGGDKIFFFHLSNNNKNELNFFVFFSVFQLMWHTLACWMCSVTDADHMMQLMMRCHRCSLCDVKGVQCVVWQVLRYDRCWTCFVTGVMMSQVLIMWCDRCWDVTGVDHVDDRCWTCGLSGV